MFELLRTCELAKSEKNRFVRFLCIKYVKRELKYKFFDRYKGLILNKRISLNVDLFTEFKQFYECTSSETKVRTTFPYICEVDSGLLKAQCYDKFIMMRANTNHSIIGDIITPECSESFSIHDDYVNHYKFNVSFMVLRAMYNYCVSYVYGEDSNLYIG